MQKFFNIIKKNYGYLLLFVFFFLCLLLFYNLNRGDLYVNYGFSYAISKLEVPYKDFNMVITPFAPFIYSFFLFINKSIITYYLEQALFLTSMFYLLQKLLQEKAYLFLTIMLIPFPIPFASTIFPGYNFFLFFLFLILIYLEKRKKNDFIIGIILGLLILTKQTVGLMLFLPNFYFLFKDYKKFFKRLAGLFLPLFIFLIYLLITKSFTSFFDLCFLGLFSFAKRNNVLNYFYLSLFLLGIIYIIYKIFKDKKNILYYYTLAFSFVALPIVDYYHVALFLLALVFIFLDGFSLKIKNISKYCLTFIIGMALIWTFIEFKYLQKPVFKNYHNFPLTLISKNYSKNIDNLSEYLKEKDQEVIYLLRGSENYFFKIMNNKEITYFDLSNYGNYGYNGIDKMLKKISKKEDVYFILDKTLEKDNNMYQQYVKEFSLFAKKNSKLEKEIGPYQIYYRK